MILNSMVRLVSQLLSSLALLTLFKLLMLDNIRIDSFLNEKLGLAAIATFGPTAIVPHIYPHSLAIALPVTVAAYCYTYTIFRVRVRESDVVLFIIALAAAVLLAVHVFASLNRDGDLQYATFVYLLIAANLLRSYYVAFIIPPLPTTSCISIVLARNVACM